MADSAQGPGQQRDPLQYVLESARKKMVELASFSLELMVHPRRFAERRLLSPEPSAILRASKNLL